jgi:dephospho-CoA kinase
MRWKNMKNNKKIIFGFVGLIASGKGTAAKYLAKKYQASTHRFSTSLREVLRRLYLEENRDNLITLSECLRKNFGQDLLAKIITQDALKDKKRVIVVEGIRRLDDIKYLSKLPNFILVEIVADSKIRYQRLIERGENTDDNAKTYQEFLADHKKSTEITIAKVIKLAQEKINNNGSEKDTQKQLDKLMKKYGN